MKFRITANRFVFKQLFNFYTTASQGSERPETSRTPQNKQFIQITLHYKKHTVNSFTVCFTADSSLQEKYFYRGLREVENIFQRACDKSEYEHSCPKYKSMNCTFINVA